MADVFCNSCGHRNPVGSNFCSSCGAVLDRAEHDHATITFHPPVPSDDPDADISVELDQVGVGTGVLVVKRGPGAGSRFALDQPATTLGRATESDIFLDDVTVSRRHAVVTIVDGGYEVADEGSLNGTYLNRERIERAPLQHGDELQVGTFKLVFFASPTAG